MTDGGFDPLAASHILLVFALMLMVAITYDWYRRNKH
jgi:hypothetical protein